MLKLFLIPMLVLQFTSVDRDFQNAKYETCKESLLEMLPQAAAGKEKAEVLWRLSRVYLLMGDQATEKTAKRALYGEGVIYAEEAIKEDPSNEQCYMWHCGNLGRECQTHGLGEQVKSVPAMQKDLVTILDKLGRVRCSEAWQGLSELYWKHPLKSKESAVNYARRAVYTIPSGELRISSCLYLAQILNERGWSAGKRAAQAASHAEKFNSTKKSNIEQYSFYDGSSDRMPWLNGAVGEVSDKEEAMLLVKYALGRYEACKNPTVMDRQDHSDLTKWKKNLE